MAMKLLATLALLGSTALFATGTLPCPCELGAAVGSALLGQGDTAPAGAIAAPGEPSGIYVEVRNATVWGGACHIGSEAVSQGTYAASGWAFDGGSHDGVDLAGVRLVAMVQGSSNLQAEEVFRAGVLPTVRSAIWVDASSERAAEAAVELVRGRVDLGTVTSISRAPVLVARSGDVFCAEVPGVLSVRGEALPDRSCCTMPESLWYSPLATGCDAVVGNPATCRFSGHGAGRTRLSPWAFEGENSAFVGRLGA